jgi:hypothetical protein
MTKLGNSTIPSATYTCEDGLYFKRNTICSAPVGQLRQKERMLSK